MEIQLFGAFRDFDALGLVTLKLSEPQTLDQIRSLIVEKFSNLRSKSDLQKLLADSAFATDTEVLPPEAIVLPDARIALLPPVCGG